jgi:hypothetical protein
VIAADGYRPGESNEHAELTGTRGDMGEEQESYGRNRRCPDCRGRGRLPDEPINDQPNDKVCSLCKGVPYIDGMQPDHWCTACNGQPLFQDGDCHPIWVPCPGPPSPRTEENTHLADELQTVEYQLSDLASDVSMDLDEPSTLLHLADQLDKLAAALRTRAANDPLRDVLLGSR